MDATWPAMISAFASACSAAAAAFGNFRASREMKRWRDQRREGKRADVAAEVLVTTLRFLTSLSNLTSTLVVSVVRRGPEDDGVVPAEMARRYDSAMPAAGDFIKAWELAETYLADEVTDLLERIWDARADIMSSQMTYFSVPPPHGAEAHKEGFGSVPEQRLAALRAEARKILRPLAQHGDDETSKRSRAERELAGAQRSQLSSGG